MKNWKRSKSTYGEDLKLFRPRFDWMINPRNGHEQQMIVLEGGDSVQVIATNEQQEMLLVQQYRFGIAEMATELPGGLIDDNETPLVAAQRELLEETGYTAQRWQYLGKQAANPVFMEAWVHHFAADGLTKTTAQSLDDGEDVQLLFQPIFGVQQQLLSGQFVHPHTVCGLLSYFAKSWASKMGQ